VDPAPTNRARTGLNEDADPTGKSPGAGVLSLYHALQEGIRHRLLARVLAPYLNPQQSVLDVGAGSGRLAARLADRVPGLRLAGIDLFAARNPGVPMVAGNARRLPFDRKAFDCVVLADVLHHDRRPGELLAEAGRVADRIVIKDHYWETPLDRALLRWADDLGNKPYGIPLPYTFHTLEAWSGLFDRVGLRVRSSAHFRLAPLYPCNNVIFELDSV